MYYLTYIIVGGYKSILSCPLRAAGTNDYLVICWIRSLQITSFLRFHGILTILFNILGRDAKIVK